MDKTELGCWVGFNHLGIGAVTFAKLLKYFGSAEKAWKADFQKLEKLDSKLAEKIVAGRRQYTPEKLLEKIQKAQIKVITIKDQQYPANLAQIGPAPYILYLKGEIKPGDTNAIAVVGTRKVTAYGKQVTESLVTSLVNCGLTIVSGLAKGVDSVAHRAAIAAGGRTIGVLGSGIDVCYPAENKKLYLEIANNGAVISEFPPGTPARRENFPVRNRIIAGLSLGVLVTEAAGISGSLITAGLAGEYGREVFAVPGPVYSAMSEGTANLIKDGAKLVYKVSDILEELNLDIRSQGLGVGEKRSRQTADSGEAKILEVLDNEPKHIDKIIKRSGLPASEVLAKLTLLEIKGVVKSLGGGVYCLG